MKKVSILMMALSLMASMMKAEDERVLMTIAGEEIKASEFLYIYEKNNTDNAVEQKSMREYLDLFINFKLKVHEAEVLGFDTTANFKKEFAQYRDQATPKYLKDEEAIDSLVKMSYNHKAWDRRAAHIVVACPKDATDSVQQAAWAKISEIRQRVTTGLPKKVGKGKKAKTVCEKEDFFEVAKQYSEDPSVAQNGGELGWIIPFRYVYSFEEAVYNTPVGEVSEIFRSPFGYHIALVEEEKPHVEVNAAHIMKMVRRDDATEDAAARVMIDSIYKMVKNGADFEETARTMSDDKGSAIQGGNLGWFGLGAMVKPFEEAAFRLGVGEISEPFRSNYGWHIILKKGERGMEPLDSVYAAILKSVQRDERMKEADKSFIRKARAEYNLSTEQYSDAEVMAYVKAHLEEKYPEFANLVKEYHDGILLFDVSLQEVWDKAGQDLEGLKACFNAHKKEYKWDSPRYKGFYVQAKDEASAKAAKTIIQSCMKREPDSIVSYINQRVNIDSIPSVKVKQGLWEQGRNKAVDVLAFGAKDSTYKADAAYPIAFVKGKKLKAPECYEDVRAIVTTQYQDELEQRWIEALRKKYEVVVNEEVFNSLVKSEN
ncbi:MAG: peptidylprolyl isomerase [Paludibacteraceae bacterium]|nr:peptidylprolyl isomerase [Paludibacteraceae bacterium]